MSKLLVVEVTDEQAEYFLCHRHREIPSTAELGRVAREAYAKVHHLSRHAQQDAAIGKAILDTIRRAK